MNIFGCCKKPQADPPTPIPTRVFHTNPLFIASAQEVTKVPSFLTLLNSFSITDASSAHKKESITIGPSVEQKSTRELLSPRPSTPVLDAAPPLEGRCSSVTLY